MRARHDELTDMGALGIFVKPKIMISARQSLDEFSSKNVSAQRKTSEAMFESSLVWFSRSLWSC